MAGLETYESVYRGRPVKSWEMSTPYPQRYYGREVIHPPEIPVNRPLAEDNAPVVEDDAVKKYIGLGCGLVSLITENLLIHPFVVLRRQCQVNPGSTKYHLIPITLVPVIVRLHQTQGVNTLWKGIGSVLLVRGMTLAVEDLISKVTPWPKKVTCNSSLKAFGQHILLKCVSIGIVTPFYSASLVETVQSEIASECPGILDVFRDGAIRLLDVCNKGRLIPIYALVPPTIIYGVSKYLFTLTIRGVTSRIMHIRYKHIQEARGAYSKDLLSESVVQDIEMQSILVSMCAADILFYPLETVIHRLHLQGTRTIIDNLDTGKSVTPLLTGYSSATDCYNTIISTEGPFGLYKGFGALILQFSVHVVVLRATKWLLTELSAILVPKPKSMKLQKSSYYDEI
ncbi:PREDICTED: solute carrier family 25 member 46-like [Dinoponera quadriceps]|uniref:Solute carrier family 25 member 46-like n=1 Tax=Dinoponera quadriceps TaxID=609295 RepID=A0A6P3XL35_DINQU|nr:PREDICTED: solute carrier family 25 member 46-like [Dinoponera quadriceps]XP_014478685.1 PREDICTED: solute carrier family 25 member 46-like [Dinoponera quadriceps]XP_014478686.1 PREDICTED: solute carrier family 25 member 46-like [Dinoponera quadriceps]